MDMPYMLLQPSRRGKRRAVVTPLANDLGNCDHHLFCFAQLAGLLADRYYRFFSFGVHGYSLSIERILEKGGSVVTAQGVREQITPFGDRRSMAP
jgi:hypothetical protein